MSKKPHAVSEAMRRLRKVAEEMSYPEPWHVEAELMRVYKCGVRAGMTKQKTKENL